MTLNDKIKQILFDKNISPSFFADEIGIQRSSVSHILAGRNKPSLDIVQKIIRRFPELGMSWILDDEDLPETRPEQKDLIKSTETVPSPDSPELRRKNIAQDIPVQTNVVKDKMERSDEKRVERVIIFYSDGTFQEMK
jgi:transcriptional regulator with XRE-family HTH domain